MPSDSYYPDTANTAAAPDEAGKADDKMDKEKEEEYKTALLPKYVLGGKKFDVGEEVVLKIVHDHGDEVEVQYATGEEKPEKGDMEEGEGGSDMNAADSKLESMADNPGHGY
jgi:hypothetical protein